jgi:hypothetical protein
MGVEDRPWLLRGVVVGIALVVGVVAWLATRDESGEPAAVEPTSETRLVDAEELPGVAAQTGHSVYWAGSLPGTDLEVTESSDGNVQVRYLPAGAAAGDETAGALTIGSYPLPDPVAALEEFAERPGSVIHRSRNGFEIVTNPQSPTSAYFASPDNSVQVEVYDPSPKRALNLALSGRVRPVP